MIRLGAVGDVVRTLPAASSLRAAHPGAHIAWLVEPPSAGLIEAQPWIDEVIVFPRDELSDSLARLRFARSFSRARVFLRELRRPRFDLVVDFHSILRSGVLARLSGSARRVGYARPFGRELSYWLFTDRARLSPRRVSRFERNAALVRHLGVTQPPAATPLVVDRSARQTMRERLGGGPAPVAIHPGTSDPTPYKRWPADSYARVARALAEVDGVPCVVTRGPARSDRAVAEAVVEASGGAARLAPETPTLHDLAALFASCRLYLGGDTGPLHVASLVGTPVVQLLGPTDPVENAPYPGTPARSLRVGLACSPCRRGCAAATCMSSIAVETALAAARDLLAAPDSARVASAGAS